MEPVSLAIFVVLGLLAGLLIGCVGIGGVLVVPTLVFVFDLPVHEAVAATMLAFLLSGVVGTLTYASRRSIQWRPAGWLCLGAMPAAFIGALAANAAPARLIEVTIGILAAASGIHAVLTARHQRLQPERAAPSDPALAGTGAVTGFLSSLTGTGGPLVLVPLLFWLEMPVLTSVGLAQAIQLPIAALGTTGHVLSGSLNVTTGAAIGSGIGLGTWIGARIAHTVPHRALRSTISLLLVLTGSAIVLRVVVSL